MGGKNFAWLAVWVLSHSEGMSLKWLIYCCSCCW